MDEAPTGGDDAVVSDPMVGDPVREGRLVRLRRHVAANRPAFQRWYADGEIARLLRHDQEPLNEIQSRVYFDSLILPLSARGLCYAIHEAATDRLIGTTALTDVAARPGGGRGALFRIVIGEKDVWGRGYGTEATRLVMDEAFATHDLSEVRLEVFRQNPRALAAYQRVGFAVTGEHVEWVSRKRMELHVVEMSLGRDHVPRPSDAPARATASGSAPPAAPDPAPTGDDGAGPTGEGPARTPEDRAARRARREERERRRGERERRQAERQERQQRREGDAASDGETPASPS